MLASIARRACENCGTPFRPRVNDQRFCRRWCRLQRKAAEGRAARRCGGRQGGRCQQKGTENMGAEHTPFDNPATQAERRQVIAEARHPSHMPPAPTTYFERSQHQQADQASPSQL